MARFSSTKVFYRADTHAMKDHQAERRLYRQRLILSMSIVFVLFGVLVYRFVDLQILSHQDYATLSDRNRIQLRPVPPNRGLIYDTDGVILAENRAVQTLSIVRERVKNLDTTLSRLAQIIDISDRDRENFQRSLKLRLRPYEPVPLKFNLSEKELAQLAVIEYSFDGLEVQGQLVRHYPYDDMFAHVIGYVGRISESELQGFSEEQDRQYRGSQSIGKIGLEKYYETPLHGDVGQESIETDARGRILKVLGNEAPVAGRDLQLFVSMALQKKALEALDGRRGSVVALDVKTGGVLAMVSAPAYDPNLFVLGISSKDYADLNTSKDLPLFNRAIQAQYPPGSTVKPMLGLGGLDAGLISRTTQIYDRGFYQLENDERFYREWKKGGHGAKVDLHQAIVESCDIFFYDLGFRMGVDQMHPVGVRFGLGEVTNIDIPNEKPGLWPSREWKKRERGMNWYPGNSLNMSIGQGDVLTTPLQLALMVSTIARRGSLLEPRIVRSVGGVDTVPQLRSSYEVPDEYWNLIIQSMRDVVHSRRGTAQAIGSKMKIEMAGKTGTAQVVGIAQDEEYKSEALSERNRDHALFVAFAPVDDPQIAVAVVIENGEKSSRSADVARQLIEFYLEGK